MRKIAGTSYRDYDRNIAIRSVFNTWLSIGIFYRQDIQQLKIIISIGGTMNKPSKKNVGLKLLIDKYKKAFRIPENINYYSDKDYQNAEKKFIKHSLTKGKT